MIQLLIDFSLTFILRELYFNIIYLLQIYNR